MSDSLITIALPSLIHRIGRTSMSTARELALQYECELKRVRRSRHWQLVGEFAQIELFKQALIDSDVIVYQFMLSKITTALVNVEPPLTLEQQLAQLILNNPTITIAELVSLTHCSEAEARVARFNNETL
ncbi:ribosome recycling factor family protein [Vibrio scophthalmi]|uniref:Ribosome recycling factor n=1 Tax=Vibrio scophthalmi LMG 19158 TaxID=870967 RepID=F9RRX9_9VIBR|nr:ribosome recycling factor family protein [Vibrio scophthalmi]EGU32809.1 hypothetical protein VIS19158_17181 [Vibrio scophthalmi LMG 19158]